MNSLPVKESTGLLFGTVPIGGFGELNIDWEIDSGSLVHEIMIDDIIVSKQIIIVFDLFIFLI